MRYPTEQATLALADTDSGRLLRALSLQGPTATPELATLLQLPPRTVTALLERASALGVVTATPGGGYRVEPHVLEAVVRNNRARLLGDAA